ncbi:hypothetical protein HII36_55055 [Nonomuraea sp. NN258]|uniref:hypothetical protein n=1 Tax=Nonomuraea antri TaxID=2730852 RepID=UPI001569469D|nr:hypothetical protein [Nonomuraea antri]NRQ40869.1 hypothetical protein [Nonomuraea antri]
MDIRSQPSWGGAVIGRVAPATWLPRLVLLAIALTGLLLSYSTAHLCGTAHASTSTCATPAAPSPTHIAHETPHEITHETVHETVRETPHQTPNQAGHETKYQAGHAAAAEHRPGEPDPLVLCLAGMAAVAVAAVLALTGPGGGAKPLTPPDPTARRTRPFLGFPSIEAIGLSLRRVAVLRI